jgi:hypothetical protein
MKKFFHIKENVVVNVTVQSDDFVPPAYDVWLEDDGIHGIGDIYDPESGELSKPAPLEPEEP